MVTEELEVVNRPQAEDTAPRGLLAALVDRLIGPFRRGKVHEHRPAMGFYTDTTVCIGCKACEVACKQWNQLPADGFTFTGDSYDNTGELSASSWRHVRFIEQFADEIGKASAAAAPPRLSLDVLPTPEVSPPQPQPDWGRSLMTSDGRKHCAAAPCQQASLTGA